MHDLTIAYARDYQQKCAREVVAGLGEQMSALVRGVVVGHPHGWSETDFVTGTAGDVGLRICCITKAPRPRRTLFSGRLEIRVVEIHEKMISVDLKSYPVVKCNVFIRDPKIFRLTEEKMGELVSLIHAKYAEMIQH